MEEKKEKLIREGNALYEIDLECIKRREKLKRRDKEKQKSCKIRQKG